MGSYPITTSSIAGACRGMVIYLLTMLICLRASLLTYELAYVRACFQASPCVAFAVQNHPPPTIAGYGWPQAMLDTHDVGLQTRLPSRKGHSDITLPPPCSGQRSSAQLADASTPKPDLATQSAPPRPVTAPAPTPKSTNPGYPSVSSQRTRPLTT